MVFPHVFVETIQIFLEHLSIVDFVDFFEDFQVISEDTKVNVLQNLFNVVSE